MATLFLPKPFSIIDNKNSGKIEGKKVNMFNNKLLYVSISTWLILILLLGNSALVKASTIQTLPSDQSTESVRPVTNNTIRLLVVIANFPQGDTLQITNEEVREIIFGTGKSLKNFYRENSEGVLDIVGDVVGPLEVAYPPDHEIPNLNFINHFILNVVDPYVDLNGYDRVLLISTNSGPCIGLASGYGPVDFITDEGILNLAVAKVTGQCVKIFNSDNTILHEFGHTLGLGHVASWFPSSLLKCPYNIPLDLENFTDNSACYFAYGGGTVMGVGNSDLNNVQRKMLATAFSEEPFEFPSLTITENGDYWVHWFKDNQNQIYYEELKVPGGNGYFSIEFRKNNTPPLPDKEVFINFVPNVRLTSAIPAGNYLDSILVRELRFSLQNINDTYIDSTRNFSVRILNIEESRALLRVGVE